MWDLLKSGKARRLISNISLRMGGNVASKLLSLVSFPIIARALGPEVYGKYSLVIAVLAYTAIAIDFGFSVYGIREIAKGENRQTMVSDILSARLVLGAFSIVIGAIVCWFVFEDNRSIFYLTVLGYMWILARVLEVDFFFYGIGNIVIPTVSQIGGQLFFVAGVILLIREPDHIVAVIVLYTAYHLLAAGFMLITYVRRFGRVRLRFSIASTINLLRRVAKLGITGRLEMLFNTFPILVISALMGAYYVGVYAASFKFFTISLMAYQAIMLNVAPHLVRLASRDPQRQRRVIWLLVAGLFTFGLCLAGVLLVSGEFIITVLLGKQFSGAVEVFYLICALLVPMHGLTTALGYTLVYFDEESKYLINVIAATAASMVLVPLFTHLWGLQGTVTALFTANVVGFTMNLYFVNEVVPGFLLPLRRMGTRH